MNDYALAQGQHIDGLHDMVAVIMVEETKNKFDILGPNGKVSYSTNRSIAVLKLVNKIAHAVEFRSFLLLDYMRQKDAGKRFLDDPKNNILKRPSDYEDFVNLLCFLDPDKPVFLIDVGANVGDFTAQFIDHFPNTEAVLFEPVSTTYAEIEKRFAGKDKISYHQTGISSEPGEMEIYCGADNTLSSFEKFTDETGEFRDIDYEKTEKVKVETLKNISIPRGKQIVLKVDVQGHEIEVFAGADDALSKIDVCIVECSFADEYRGKEPSFSPICEMMRVNGLYPAIFQNYGRMVSSYSFERDVIFVKRNLLDKIFYQNYGH